MKYFLSLIRSASCFIALCFLVGCFAPPRRHAWQLSREDLQLRDADTCSQLSTNDYVRVIDSRRADAVALLQEHAFVQIDTPQLAEFAPHFQPHPERGAQSYLVRGVLFSSPPAYTVVRYDPATARLLVQQFTWNGEMLMPFRWVAKPNALVVFLPRPPEHVYSDAVLGGDGIFRGTQWNALDIR
jgi:hypothetical protein